MSQTKLDTDLFNGVNGTGLPSYTPTNGTWVNAGSNHVNDAAIESTPGVGNPSGNCADYKSGVTWTNDQWAQLQVDGTNLIDTTFGRWSVLLRVQGGTSFNCYACGVDAVLNGNLGYRIARYDQQPGGYVSLKIDPGANAMQTNDIVNGQIQGTTITMSVTRNNSVLTTFSYDTAPDGVKLSTGNVGLFFQCGTSSLRLAGTWNAGAVLAGGFFTATNPMNGLGVGGSFFANPLG